MTVKLKNTSGGALYFGRPDGKRVEAGEVIEVEGSLAPKKDQHEDATVVIDGDEARAFPHSTWTVYTAKASE